MVKSWYETELIEAIPVEAVTGAEIVLSTETNSPPGAVEQRVDH